MGIQLRRGSSGDLLEGTATGQTIAWDNDAQDWDVSSGVFFLPIDPVYVERYLLDAAGDIRTAIVAAFLDNPDSHTFILPSGSWEFVGATIKLSDGFRNDLEIIGQKTELFRDLNGVAGGSNVFFHRTQTDATHASGIVFRGIKFSLLNVLTSFFGAAIALESAANCRVYDCEFYCTLDAAATQGRIRWGLALFGGDQVAVPAAGTNNIVDNVKTTLSQIQLCATGRSVDGVLCTNIQCNSAIDFCISCVTSVGFNVRNVIVDSIEIHDIAGSGGVFVGSDGTGTGIGPDVVENVTINNVSIDGQNTPVLEFKPVGFVVVDLGHTSQNIAVSNINTTLAPSAGTQARSIVIQAQDDGASETGVSVCNCNLGTITSDDQLEALFVVGNTGSSNLEVTNVHVKGIRGIKINDWDRVTISNVTTTDGTVTFTAERKSVNGVTVVGATLKRTTGFNPALAFLSTSAKNFSNVALGTLILDGSNPSLLTLLAGGTMRMICSGVWNVNGSNLSAETLTGILCAVACPAIVIITTVSVVVPAVLAGNVGYVDVSMAGTRLSTLATGEAVVVNPQADLVAAGAGGAFVNARVSATGSVRCAFVGPLAGGASNFSFARAA